ncbi:hypothetical protein K402DRAFT_371227 [Aulographum hederae CBS 113979]|uniref:Uncharacterized protein n=1 Tax=Aulographum hederae CBS 113979 TaxID=1176131 RepID=A0A6G1HAV7_9PEZI|nr:hypothetical protein K402DRAFT_371227 [Aulographum hederae CBS 113979]
MQPDATNASYGPTRPLAWGQLNFLHTTDTHGWLEGHILERNYGADWGDFVSFTKAMKNKADKLGVDLLVVDTGDLHDGAGLSDATSPNGVLSNPIFETVDYDLLAIGNHELYVSAIAYEHFYNFSRHWGEKYVTSNVQIINPATNELEYIGSKYRYFTTKNGLRIMAFGLLYDFTGNSNVSVVTPAANLTQEAWWKNAIKGTPNNETTPLPIDVFVLVGHNPVLWSDYGSTFEIYYDSIRSAQPDVPIQVFGGHSHIRDFAVYDQMTTALESGRYCETLGWLSMSGIRSSSYAGASSPAGVPHPNHLALSSNKTNNPNATNIGASLKYSRRYLDWNRLTFEFHATGSQNPGAFDYYAGTQITKNITATRQQLNLTNRLGCAPETWCLSCEPFGSQGNIYSGLLPKALTTIVKNETRADIPRIIIINSGSIRFDLVQGPFTTDDGYIVSPFDDIFQYIPNVPYNLASQVLDQLNAAGFSDKRSLDLPSRKQTAHGVHERQLSARDFNFGHVVGDDCKTPDVGVEFAGEEVLGMSKRGVVRRQEVTLTPGYTTDDDFGDDGDDTPHTHIPDYSASIPTYVAGTALLPSANSTAPTDLVFIDYIVQDVLDILTGLGGEYSEEDIGYYINDHYTTNDYLPDYAKVAWRNGTWATHCPYGLGVGGDVA